LKSSISKAFSRDLSGIGRFYQGLGKEEGSVSRRDEHRKRLSRLSLLSAILYIWEVLMRTTLSFALALALVTVSAAEAQSFAGIKTGIYVNGRYWKNLSVDAKATYLVAIGEGMMEIVAYAKNCSCVVDASLGLLRTTSGGDNNSYLEMAEGLDSFYMDPANRPIPVIRALSYVTLKMKGASSRELEDLASKLRKDF
jgi:hypothetical protein